MRTHQKYFAVRVPGRPGLAPRFLVVANIAPEDGGALIAAGNARVLSARLNDARFFWDEDRKTPLGSRLEKLKGVTFHARLGTMHERVERIAALARELAPLVGADPKLAETAARLAKADLATGMVGEFPELQGIMGGYYARAEPFAGVSVADLREAEPDGQEDPLANVDQLVLTQSPPSSSSEGARPPKARGPGDAEVSERAGGEVWWRGLSRADIDGVADAIRDHYKPLGPTDSAPGQPVSVAVALADKLDTLVGFFAIDEKPTGSKDPYALRRAALGVIRIVLENRLRLGLRQFAEADLLAFFADRLKVTLREQGRRHDLVDAVFALGDDDLVRIVARVEALDAFLATEDGENLLAGHRRAVNILKAEAKKNPGEAYDGAVDPALLAAPEERALDAALQQTIPALERYIAQENFEAAMSALAALRKPVDEFFDKVLVNDPDPAVRLNRLRLLTRIRDAAGKVADFSLISG